MRWRMLFLLLCFIALSTPLVHASSSSLKGWYYAGDTFEYNGIVHSVEGIDSSQVLLGIGDSLKFIKLNTCIKVEFTEYCYDATGYPDDEKHIKYAGGDIFYGYYLTMTTTTPDLAITRTISNSKPDPGENVDVSVAIANNGDYTIKGITYTEKFSDNVTVANGPSLDAHTVQQTFASLPAGANTAFKYKLSFSGFAPSTTAPNITYTYEDVSYSKLGPFMTITVNNPVSVKTTLDKNAYLGQPQTLAFTVTNKRTDRYDIKVIVTLPDGTKIDKFNGFVMDNGNFVSTDTLEDRPIDYELTFIPTTSGTKVIKVQIITYLNDGQTSQTLTPSTVVSDLKLKPEIIVIPDRNSLFPGTELTVLGVITNENPKTGFPKVSGRIEGGGLFAPLSFRHDLFLPLDKITEMEKKIITPSVSQSTTYTIHMTGRYYTPAGQLYPIDIEKTVTVAPFESKVKVIHTFSPTVPIKGTNVTVTVNVENIWDKYLTLDVTDSADATFPKIGGLSFATLSIDRGKKQKAYIYTLDIPEDYTGDSFNITTTATIKGDTIPQKYVTVIPLTNPVTETTPTTPVNNTKTTTEKQPGTIKKFFSSVWNEIKGTFISLKDFIKGLFSKGSDAPTNAT